MSVHYVYKRDGGAKFMRPIHSREEYLSLRNGGEQIPLMKRIRAGEEQLKTELVQMNYSCLPNEDGAYDSQAKDITRVFFTTSGDQLLYLDDAIFEIQAANLILATDYRTNRTDAAVELAPGTVPKTKEEKVLKSCSPFLRPSGSKRAELERPKNYPKDYHGIPFTDIIAKYWEVNNRGFEPTQGDRDTLTYQLACDLRHICGRNFEWLDQVIPCYVGREAREDQECSRLGVQWLSPAPPQHAECAGNLTEGTVPIVRNRSL